MIHRPRSIDIYQDGIYNIFLAASNGNELSKYDISNNKGI
jgi:hypothetical protein